MRRGRVADTSRRGTARGPVALVTIRRRDAACPDRVEAQRVILATGAGAGMGDDPLLAGLIATGTARPDGNHLGLEVTDALEVVGRDGAPAPGLWALGPIVRGTFWECTAVPDIRVQAQAVAASVARYLEGVPGRGAEG